MIDYRISMGMLVYIYMIYGCIAVAMVELYNVEEII